MRVHLTTEGRFVASLLFKGFLLITVGALVCGGSVKAYEVSAPKVSAWWRDVKFYTPSVAPAMATVSKTDPIQSRPVVRAPLAPTPPVVEIPAQQESVQPPRTQIIERTYVVQESSPRPAPIVVRVEKEPSHNDEPSRLERERKEAFDRERAAQKAKDEKEKQKTDAAKKPDPAPKKDTPVAKPVKQTPAPVKKPSTPTPAKKPSPSAHTPKPAKPAKSK